MHDLFVLQKTYFSNKVTSFRSLSVPPLPAIFVPSPPPTSLFPSDTQQVSPRLLCSSSLKAEMLTLHPPILTIAFALRSHQIYLKLYSKECGPLPHPPPLPSLCLRLLYLVLISTFFLLDGIQCPTSQFGSPDPESTERDPVSGEFATFLSFPPPFPPLPSRLFDLSKS